MELVKVGMKKGGGDARLGYILYRRSLRALGVC
jgi:hypothetical protein